MLEIPKEALFLAGKAYRKYRAGKGLKGSSMPISKLGTRAVPHLDLITRDVTRYRTYFPTIETDLP